METVQLSDPKLENELEASPVDMVRVTETTGMKPLQDNIKCDGTKYEVEQIFKLENIKCDG